TPARNTHRRTKQVSGFGWERKSREKQLRPLENESPAAYQIAIDQPTHWEYLLTVELLRSKFNPITREFDDLHRGLMYQPSKVLSTEHFIPWVQQKLNDMGALGRLLALAPQELNGACGQLGQPGDALEIK